MCIVWRTKKTWSTVIHSHWFLAIWCTSIDSADFGRSASALQHTCKNIPKDLSFGILSIVDRSLPPSTWGNVYCAWDQVLTFCVAMNYCNFGIEKTWLGAMACNVCRNNLTWLPYLSLQNSVVRPDMFMQVLREFNYCQESVARYLEPSTLDCPCCSNQQHAAHIDGNFKLYRLKGNSR